jgi:hypothetical protein
MEQYAYAASSDLAAAIAQRAGPDALREVWVRASGNIGAYQPPVEADPEPGEGPPDWRGLLDLLEEASGRAFDDLWRERVARPADVAAIDERAAARVEYQRSVETAGEWRLPGAIRSAMRAWQFGAARELLSAADAVANQRTALQTTAAAAGLQLPDRLRVAFEGGGGFEAAANEAQVEQTVVDAIVRARVSQPLQAGLLDQVINGAGLLGTTPDVDLANAAAALASGDMKAAYASALEAEAAWTGAPQVGRSRIVSAALLFLALILLVGLVWQGRRRGRPETANGAGGEGDPDVAVT